MTVFFINPFLEAAGGDFEPITTVTVGSGGASSITFSSIPGTYQHLQVRVLLIGVNFMSYLRLNGDSGSNYAHHSINGNGTGVATSAGSSAARIECFYPENSTYPTVGVIDILDYSDTAKNTTVRFFSGRDYNGTGVLHLGSGLWNSTSAVTSMSVTALVNSFAQYSTAALYGIKAP